METTNTLSSVTLADVYGLLLDDIRNNRAARLAREAAQRDPADDHAAQPQADETQRQGVHDDHA